MNTRGENISSSRFSAAQDTHRKEVLWQITIPLIVAMVILILVVVGSIFLPDMVDSRWASISLIWLILPNLIIVLFITVILGGILYGIIRLIGALPRLFGQLLDILDQVQELVGKASDTATKPIFAVNGWVAAVRALIGKQP